MSGIKIRLSVLIAMLIVVGISKNYPKLRSNNLTDVYSEEDIYNWDKADSIHSDINSEIHLKIENNKAYLCKKSGKIIFGPCSYIFDDIGIYNNVFRYVDKNGLIGYAKINDNQTVSVIQSGKFLEASEMLNGSACVKEKDAYYYINKRGEHSKYKYNQAYPFSESQGFFARVKNDDATWSIIDKEENIILDGFEKLEPLPYLTAFGVGVKNKKVVVFSLDFDNAIGPQIIFTLDNYNSIHILKKDSIYGIVTDQHGQKGVINICNGNTVIPSKYRLIKSGFVNGNNKERWFSCESSTGTLDFYYLKGE